MEIVIILITATLLLLILIIGIYESNEHKSSCMNVIAPFSAVFVFIILIAALSLKEKPKAIDVYKEKTTLEITYKDRVAIDSTVVFKNK